MKSTNAILKALPAFQHRNFRLFWSGQLISLIGTWMQNVALGWLIYRITNSPFFLGLMMTMNSLPILLFSLFAGIIADRVNKRLLVIITQSAFTVQALVLAILVSTGHYNIWVLLAFTFLAGTIQAFDAPTRQSFVSEMVSKDHVLSAVAMNSAVFNAARTIGPAIGGLLVKAVGESGCFYSNAISFLAVIAGMLMMRESELFREGNRNGRGKVKPGLEIKESFKYILSEKRILGVLSITAVISILGMPALTFLPVFARTVLHLQADGLGYLFAAAGVGSFIAAVNLALAKKTRRQGLKIVLNNSIFCIAIVTFTFIKSFYLSLPSLALAGYGVITGIALVNSTMQLIAPAHLRGRVMSAYVFVFMGLMPLGNFVMGTVAHYIGAPRAVMYGGLACLAALAFISVAFPAILKIDAPNESAPIPIV
jgi:predicted MFS family arabinose efflux permease